MPRKKQSPPPRKRQVDEALGIEPVETSSGATEVCWGCGYVRPLEEFTAQSFADGASGVELHCDRCRTEGPPPPEEIGWEDVNPRHRRLLEAIFVEGKTFHEVMRAEGVTDAVAKRGLKEELFGKATNGSDRSPPATRRAYQALLRQRGLDMVYLSSAIRVLAHARKPLWNPAAECWDWFPDNAVRLKAVELLHKLHDVVPRNDPSEADRGPQRTIVILHNLDSQVSIDVGHQGSFVATPGPPTIDVTASPAEGA